MANEGGRRDVGGESSVAAPANYVGPKCGASAAATRRLRTAKGQEVFLVALEYSATCVFLVLPRVLSFYDVWHG